MMAVEFFQVLGTNVSNTNLDLAVEQISDWIKQETKTYICVAPVSTIVDAQQSDEYRQIVNSAGMVTPDGMPVVWCGKAQGMKPLERTYGPDLMLKMCREGQASGVRHFFYGGMPETLRLLEKRLKNDFPQIKIAGMHSPDFLTIGEMEKDDVIEKINASQCDILWIGLGSPKQDHWMKNHRSILHAPVMIGVGAAFDFHAGVKPQAPKWMRQSGLEWFFRLMSEPRRLWKRYLIGNSKFIYYLVKDRLQKVMKNT